MYSKFVYYFYAYQEIKLIISSTERFLESDIFFNFFIPIPSPLWTIPDLLIPGILVGKKMSKSFFFSWLGFPIKIFFKHVRFTFKIKTGNKNL